MMPAAVTKTHGTFVDRDGVTIHYYAWKAKKPRAVIQLAHGLGEYASRYEVLAQFLVANNISVYANDHTGHGETGREQWEGDLSKMGKPGTGGIRSQVATLHQFTGIVAAENPGIPVVFLGHSWGSLLGQKLLNEHSEDFAAAVLTGTAQRVPGQMNAGNLNARHKHLGTTGNEWLSRDPAVAQAFLDDELTFYADTIKLFGLVDGLRLFGRPTRLSHDIPLLIIIGNEDPLGGENSVRRLADDYVRRGQLSDVEVVVYTGARHEVFNETNQDEVRADLLAWLEGRLALSTTN
jgi:alpha-beta hydrolase superfamily lysophospholipase